MLHRNIRVKHKNSRRAIDHVGGLGDARHMRANPTLGQRLQAARKRRGMTQEEFGAHFRRGQSWVSKLEGEEIPITIEVIREAASILGVPARDLLPPEQTDHLASGFSECTVEAWASGQGEPFNAAALAPGARNPATFRIAHDHAANFGFLRGTVLVVDLAATAAEGDLGVANLVDPRSGSATTILGRRLGDHLIGPHFASDPTDRTFIDPQEIGAIYPVVAWFSAPQFTSRT